MIRVPDGYADPRLAATYDAENAGRDDVDWYVNLARRLAVHTVVDLGCGTGVLAVELAARGIDVTGVDPAGAMLDIARSRPGGERVTWILGDARAMPSDAADLVVMTGHVAQVFLTASDWFAVLGEIRRTLHGGGHVAFEVRNPSGEPWAAWTREESIARYEMADGRAFWSWVETTEVSDGVVRFDAITRFEDSGDEIAAPGALRFPTLDEVRASLLATGFREPEACGDWDGRPVGPTSPELILVAAAVAG